ncbi:MAG: WecB/TagA/CpsF family glycosyltransferase [Chloroherpetonaceae bacterium]|nr:WecB/TagA/CpsF family glycosyltransferase [Chloroherpetonaceae bacterium]
MDNLTMSETIELIDEAIKINKSIQHVVVNAAKVVEINKNPSLKKIVDECDIVNIDGQAVVWASRFLGFPVKERVAGIDLMEKLIEMASEKNYGVYFLGAKQEILEKVVDVYKAKYKNIKISGLRNGYFKEDEELDIAKEIAKSQTKILLVAISSPKKEFFLNKYKSVMGVPFVMGVGGSFDVVAGYVKRAPLWMQNFGLEWLFRFLQEPKRMWKRYIIGNSEFIWIVIKEKVFQKILRKK